ncbi:hypothetical protein [Rhodococcoides fascians]|uniref:hypothetical protein n=1 Tax=Rhodococcoides fascians TaxID=1828 RepID=UPI00050C5AAB|nr:hypothetical protein [Rhodococcus fascians]
MNVSDLAAMLADHVVDGVTSLELLEGGDGYLIDCKCGGEVRVTQDQLDAVHTGSTSGALAALLAPHAAEAIHASL